MRLTTFVYPWDLARLGVERTLEQLVAEGFDGIHLASTYHPIDALSPRGGTVSLFTSARGAVHFPARAERYGRIRPSTSPAAVCAVWPRCRRARAFTRSRIERVDDRAVPALDRRSVPGLRTGASERRPDRRRRLSGERRCPRVRRDAVRRHRRPIRRRHAASRRSRLLRLRLRLAAAACVRRRTPRRA